MRQFQYQVKAEPLVVTTPVDQFRWFAPLSEPVRYKYFHPCLQQFQPYQETAQFPDINTFDRWRQWWSEPVRIKPRVIEGLQQTLAFFPTPIVSFSWYQQLSVRSVQTKDGLRPDLQQFYTSPTRLLPNPNVSGTWASTETKDRLLFGITNNFRPPASANVGVKEIPIPSAPGANVGFVNS